MPKETTQRTKVIIAVVAGVLTAVFSTCILKVGDGIIAHATTEELNQAKAECMEVAHQLKVEQEKADLKLQESDVELKNAQAELSKVVTEHIKNDTADTREIMSTLKYIQRDIKKLDDKLEK